MECFRRRIEIVYRDLDSELAEARCTLEDDYHHFQVAVTAADGRVSQAWSNALRTPNTLCSAAGDRLVELVGMALSPESASVLVATDQHQQCTHQLDMAGLAIAALAQGRRHRIYEIVIPDRVEGHTRAQLFRDGECILEWQVAGMLIEGPDPYSGRHLGAGFTRFTRDLPLEEAEAALVFRRALFVSQGRGIFLDDLGDRGPVGGCWAWQPERKHILRRQPENRRDFSQRPSDLGRGDSEWLRFAE